MHSRSAIKAKVRELLIAQVEDEYLTPADSRVYKSRRLPLPEDEDGVPKLPAICIYTPKEKSEQIDTVNNKRTLQLVIECLVSDSTEEGLSTKIDAIADAVEDVLVEEPTLQDTVDTLDLVETEELDSPDGDALIGGVRLTYEIVYWAEKKASLPPGSELTGANVVYNGGEFSDEVPLPQE